MIYVMFPLTVDMSIGYKEPPSILRHRASGNEGLDELEVPYAVDEWTWGNHGNPPGSPAAQATAYQKILTPSRAEHGPEGVFVLSPYSVED